MSSNLTSGSAVVASVPFEIWHYISMFLLDSHLRQLYSVNSAFFRLAMTLRYRTVSLCQCKPPKPDLVPYSRTIGAPYLREHIQCLTLDCCRVTLPKHRNLRLTTPANSRPHPSLSQEARTFMASWQHITVLKITWIDRPYHELDCDAYSNLLSLGWPNFSPAVYSLSLAINVNSTSSLFPTHLHFPHLKQLDLDIRETKSTSDSPLYSTLMPFIHRHADTVQVLSIKLTSASNYTKFYTTLGHFPNLNQFTYRNHLFGRGEPDGSLVGFLNLHADTLTQIDWDQGVGYNLELFDARLPNLISFKFAYLANGSNCFQVVIRSFRRSIQPLASLSFLSYNLDFPELRTLLGVQNLSHLRHLELSLSRLDYSTFLALAIALPNLEQFVAHFYYFVHDDFFVYNKMLGWGVFALFLDHKDPSALFIQKWGRFLLGRLPRVEYLNGRYREEFFGGSHHLTG